MTPRRILLLAFLVVLSLALSVRLMAHPGGLDSKGGHTNKKTGEYHYHRSSSSSSSSSEKSGSSNLVGSSPTVKSVLSGYSTDKQVAALASLMERKGLLSVDELKAELDK